MSASGNTSADRTGLRTDYLPALRKSLVKPLIDQEKDGIMSVIYDMQVCKDFLFLEGYIWKALNRHKSI